MTSAVFSPDGGSVATASEDKTAAIGTVAPTSHFENTQELVDDAKRVIDRCLTGEQRVAAFLDPEPPVWCIQMQKWPYQTEQMASVAHA